MSHNYIATYRPIMSHNYIATYRPIMSHNYIATYRPIMSHNYIAAIYRIHVLILIHVLTLMVFTKNKIYKTTLGIRHGANYVRGTSELPCTFHILYSYTCCECIAVTILPKSRIEAG
jgi:hypothetical protein